MRPARALAIATAVALPLGAGGCGMVNSVTSSVGSLFDSGPSNPARRTASPSRAPEPEPEAAPPAPRVSIADKLTASDRRVIERTAARALPRGSTGEPVAWRNPDSGTRGSITPTSPAYRRGGRLCRDYQLTVQLGAGGNETLVGTRCRASGGRWPRVE